VFSHELVEIITDPEASGGWTMDRSFPSGSDNNEIGDACNNSVDFLKGNLMNAYWSERHKACIIPKPEGFIVIQTSDVTINSNVVASGTAHISSLICLVGDYHWDILFDKKIITCSANTYNFKNPQFVWRILEGSAGPIDLADGFSGTIFLATKTWYEDVSGVSTGFNTFPLEITVNKDKLITRSTSAGNLFSFLLKIQVTASEGPVTASYQTQFRVKCEALKFEDRYYTDLERCRERLWKLIDRMLPKIPPIGPGDPAWIWIDKLSPWISGDRLQLMAEIASLAAAYENSDPLFSYKMRSEAALIGNVPMQMLMPQQIKLGIPREIELHPR